MKNGEIQKILISGSISIRMLQTPSSPIILTFQNHQSIERFVVNDQFCQPIENSFSGSNGNRGVLEWTRKLSYIINQDIYNFHDKDVVVVKYALDSNQIGKLPIYIFPETRPHSPENVFFRLQYKSEGYLFDKLTIGVDVGNSNAITNPVANYDVDRGVLEWTINRISERGALEGVLEASAMMDGDQPGDVFCSFLISNRLMSMLEVDSNGVFEVIKSIVNGTYSASE
jgi:hypothetical protein